MLMYKSLIILPLLILTVQALGKFSVLEHSNSLEFKGNDKLDSNFIGDVFGAALGFYVNTESKWEGIYINDPFELPKGVVNIVIEGVNEIRLNQKTKSYSLFGSKSRDSLNMISSTAEALNSPTINADLSKGLDSLFTYTELIGNLQVATASKSSANLKPDVYSEDKLFLQQIAAINALSNKVSNFENKPSLINIRLSLRPLIIAHGINSPAFAEVLKTLTETIENFSEASRRAYSNQLLFTVVTDDSAVSSFRQKRQAQTDAVISKEINLAPYYKEDYPVIFNIILWFMVVFVFALLSISYVIATMDPGRDSIIYRMTSTRMKKDN